ncbi:aminoacyl-tRNA hydrolase [bacterium (Candidatus Blackallbacteria) CG17_big_fil_post_rev_8_21_14_2_50_48_46]|uniref:Peptidyl-tRNA hydrolase n=1 Tax=bacterium (Candidatus Blackallbacteria) CG17_big_fil_post_rev_8_21_14_2_50_48_46 TaxID=2014261 RepID=A0A2M7G3P1_9BACT|nr:MAG: aminoacyl-tRNA hydrolase [bacterium (Candidatus Blackallbacteria) CG18_big_fil_WC_8_21_14_2_50_49_26]PIW16498.1 MAG: aminoacyl-tRNA hydrolase [bacterium (Candidatus Blackallbacteria) CG17_big_fil_post_rev_8_21_14_2_50_48_46]PIW46006.1 MAG: aminoacyl-tRNA hydrolase [bacterium (Candidatus Blackallbacteria) CG13_big_fil_rev_8_21_14_2_50_49_14]
MSDWLVVGLGNPGQQYEKTRHNIGWMLIDQLCSRWQTSLQARSKEKCLLGSARLGSVKVWLCKPTTYMNLSGESVQPLMAYYNIPRENLLVLSDDVHLNFGRARLRAKGSSGGQKGIQNIIQRLGSDEFARLRMGVGPFPQGRDMANFVLDRLPKPQLEALPEYMGVMADTVERCIQNGVEATIPFANGYRLPGFEN